MSDLISRQAALNAFDCTDELIVGGSANAQNVMNYINKVIGKIKALPSAQPTHPNTPNTLKTLDCISRQDAIDAVYYAHGTGMALKAIKQLPSAQPEPLTDKEQRIFLAAMAREEKVCKQFDAECRYCREPYEDSLVRTCHEITRKVKGALWT